MSESPLTHAGEAMPPDVSILVLAYNHERYIAECLEGILSQDFTGSMEVLVGEDNSTDGTAAVVDDFASRFPHVIKVVTASANVGMHANNRRLIRAARGRYIAYCEGDDVWHRPDKLRRQVDLLDDRLDVVGVHSNFDDLIYAGGAARVRTDSRRSKRLDIPVLLAYEDLIARNSVQTCSVMLRTSVLKSYPGSPLAQGIYPMDDWPMFLHALKAGPLLHMSESLATYRHTPGSMTRQNPTAMVNFLRGERRLIRDASGGRPELAAARGQGLARVRHSLVALGVRSGDRTIVSEAMAMGRQDSIPEDLWIRLMAYLVSKPVMRAVVVRGTRSLRALRTNARARLSILRRRR